MSAAATPNAPPPRLRALLGVTFVVLLAAAAWCALWFDVFAAGGSTAQARAMQLGVEFTLTTPALAAAWLSRRRWMTATYVVTLAALLALAFVPWHPRKRFVHDLFSLDTGMTVDDVETVMGRYMKGAGSKWAVPDGPAPAAPAYPGGDERTHATGTMTYRWNDTDASYDSDWGQVTFADGRVVKVEFLPD